MRRCSAERPCFSHLRELMHAVRVALRLRSRCGMKIAPRTPDLLSRRPAAASPSAEARRPTVRPLTPRAAVSASARCCLPGAWRPARPRPRPVAPARPPGRPVSGAPGDRPSLTSSPVGSASRARPPAVPSPRRGFTGAVTEFKRRLIETTLTELGGNRTRAARALGLQRTYLLRLMREFAVHVPAGAVPPRRAPEPQGTAPTPPR